MNSTEALFAAWQRQLEQERELIALAVKHGKAVQVVLYVDRKGDPGQVKVTAT